MTWQKASHPGLQLDISDERLRITAFALANDDGSVANFGDRSQDTLDLGRIDTMAMQLDAPILPPAELDQAVGATAPEIAGLVHAQLRISRVARKGMHLEAGALPITASNE